MKSAVALLLVISGTTTVGQLAQLTTEPDVVNWIDAGSTVVLTGLLVMIFKGIFLDQRWVPAKDAEHDAKVERRLERILLALQIDPDEE